MELRGLSGGANYLESLPLNKIAKYSEGTPKNGVPFVGFPQQHPTEKGKILLVHDPLGESPAVMEFKLDDILHVDEMPQAVTETGEGVPMVKLWVRRGAHGIFLEPFEVDESVNHMDMGREQKDRFSKKQPMGSL